MQNIIKKITAVLVLIFISIFLFFTVWGNEKSDFNDNIRNYDGSNTLRYALIDGSFGRQLNDNMTYNFAGRKRWISMKSKMETEISESIVNGVYVDDSRLLDAEISKRTSAVQYSDIINKYAEKYDGTVYFIAVPTSSGVYGDILPEYLLNNPENQQISSFYDSLSSEIRKIDAYNILKMLNDNYIYFRNDTKWTSYGAYCVYRTAIQKLGFLPTPYDKYTIEHITDSFRGNLYSRTLYSEAKADILDVYEYSAGAEVISCSRTDNNGTTTKGKLYDKELLNSENMYEFYLGEPAPYISLNTSVNNDKKLLVITDSYGECFVPFLTQHYSGIDIVFPEHSEKSISSYTDLDGYDQTLFLFGIENMSNEEIFSKINERG